MDQNSQNHEELEIDISQYVKTIFRRKRTFITVFLLIFVVGLVSILVAPRIYRSSMMIQPPAIGPALTGANDLVAAENLKGLIVNNAFNEEIIKRLKLDPDKDLIEFIVEIPEKTNILQVSVDLESTKKELGVVLLRNLEELIFKSYAKRIEAERIDINNQIGSNERAISITKEKSKNLQEQTKEVVTRKDKLTEEIKFLTSNTMQILSKREALTTSKAINEITGNVSTLLLSNLLQSNANYLNQLNNQFSELTMRGFTLNLELKKITSQMSDFQMEIDKLNIQLGFISNLKTLSGPITSPEPINAMRKKTVLMLIFSGLFSGLIAVFLREFWMNSLVKK